MVITGPVHLRDGRTASPFAAIADAQARCQREPFDVDAHLALGNIFDKLGPRWRAIECFEQCLKLDPRCVEAAVELAEALVDKGEHRKAYRVLRRAHEQRPRWRYYRLPGEVAEFIDSFTTLYNDTARRCNEPRLDHARLGLRSKGKLSRNAPCPCGSGKKYKRCCLSKA